jgi:uncharacterized protein involved in exopolysaccharide biosynthesis
MKRTTNDKTEWTEYILVVMKHYRLILLFVAISCIAAAIITWITPKEYSSSAVIFPTDSNALDDVLRNPQFGYDIEADRLMQLLQSRQIRDSIIRKFDLLSYFKIDKSDPTWDYILKKKFEKYIQFEKTIYMSIDISARTHDPELSAQIVNEIIVQIGKVRERLLKQNVLMALEALQREYNSQKTDLDSLGLIVSDMTSKRKNINQYLQTERYISLIFDKNQMANDESGKALQLVVNQYNTKLTWFYDVQNKLKNSSLMSMRPLPAVYVVEAAVPSYKKVFPKYSVNLLIAFAGSFLFISFLFFSIEKIKKFNSNLSG